jgi:hypothetical protein
MQMFLAVAQCLMEIFALEIFPCPLFAEVRESCSVDKPPTLFLPAISTIQRKCKFLRAVSSVLRR